MVETSALESNDIHSTLHQQEIKHRSITKEHVAEVRKRSLIEQLKQKRVIEVHEQPIVRTIVHNNQPPIVKIIRKEPVEIHINRTSTDDNNKTYLENELSNDMRELIEKHLNDQSTTTSSLDDGTLNLRREEVKTDEEEVIVSREYREVTHMVQHRKLITEIRRTPIIEIHEQIIQRTIDEHPVVIASQREEQNCNEKITQKSEEQLVNEDFLLTTDTVLEESQKPSSTSARQDDHTTQNNNQVSYRAKALQKGGRLLIRMYELLTPPLFQAWILRLLFFLHQLRVIVFSCSKRKKKWFELVHSEQAMITIDCLPFLLAQFNCKSCHHRFRPRFIHQMNPFFQLWKGDVWGLTCEILERFVTNKNNTQPTKPNNPQYPNNPNITHIIPVCWHELTQQTTFSQNSTQTTTTSSRVWLVQSNKNQTTTSS